MTEYTKEYIAVRSDSRAWGERNDCGVVALAIALDISYAMAHTVLGRQKRKNKQRVTTYKLLNALWALDCVPVAWDEKITARTVRTLERDPGIARGTFVVRTTEHILAAKDGLIHDWSAGRCLRIKNIWRIARYV